MAREAATAAEGGFCYYGSIVQAIRIATLARQQSILLLVCVRGAVLETHTAVVCVRGAVFETKGESTAARACSSCAWNTMII